MILNGSIEYSDAAKSHTQELSHALIYGGAMWAVWFVSALRLCAVDSPEYPN
jgi:hypothetical protein